MKNTHKTPIAIETPIAYKAPVAHKVLEGQKSLTKIFAIAFMIAILTVMGAFLYGCGGKDLGTFNKSTTQTSTNSNGMVIVLDLAQLSENINYVSSEDQLEIPTIDTLNVWTQVKQDKDSAGQALTYKMANLENKSPSFEVAQYDSATTLQEARVFWDTSSANSGQEKFKKYSIALIRAVMGVDNETATSLYSTAHSTQYTNGVSQNITYAYNGNMRCYYMINGGYHMLVIEPFSAEVQAADVAAGKSVYTAIGTSETASGGSAASSGTSVTSGSAASSGSSSSSTDSTNSSSNTDSQNISVQKTN